MTFVSYAQNYEDLMLWRALKHIDKGIYVDVGANDPIFDSVTQAFYERDWRGINIEPMRSCFERLCTVRPLDINLPVAVANEEGELTFYEILETGLSTIDKEIAEKQRAAGWTVIERNVSVFTLNQIFEKYLDGPIHFLKIDVEGAEKQVLQGLDLLRWRPWILLVEATIPNSSELNFDAWEPNILDSEYEFVYFDGLNRYYVALEHIALAQAFKTPPNVFDDFISNKEVLLIEKITLEDAHIKHLTNVLNGLEQQLQNIEQQLQNIEQQLQNVQAELLQVYQSNSWRITAPLRAFINIMRSGKIFLLAGKNRLVHAVISRLKSFLYWFVGFLHKIPLGTVLLNGLKSRFPQLWLWMANKTRSNPEQVNLMQPELLEDQKHYQELFRRELSHRKNRKG